MSGQARSIRRYLAAVAPLLILLAGCGPKSVALREQFPVPVVQKRPVAVMLHATPEFANYFHSERLPGAGEWEIDIGPANLAMFRQLLSGLFERSTVGSGNRPAPPASLVVTPQLQDFQFSTPELSFTEFYEAWFKYQIRFYGMDGQLVTEWPLTAYGRSEARALRGQQALRDATEIALRDAAAGFALKFSRDAALKRYLQGPAAEGARAP